MPSLVPSPLPACMKKDLVKTLGSHFLVLDVRILQPNQVAEPWSHDYVRSMLMRVHFAYAHGTEVAVSFFYAYRNCQLLHSSQTR